MTAAGNRWKNTRSIRWGRLPAKQKLQHAEPLTAEGTEPFAHTTQRSACTDAVQCLVCKQVLLSQNDATAQHTSSQCDPWPVVSCVYGLQLHIAWPPGSLIPLHGLVAYAPQNAHCCQAQHRYTERMPDRHAASMLFRSLLLSAAWFKLQQPALHCCCFYLLLLCSKSVLKPLVLQLLCRPAAAQGSVS